MAHKPEDILQTCAAEPIRIPGAIQPHGCLLSCEGPDLTIRHAANTLAYFGLPPEECLGLPLTELLDQYTVDAIRDAAAEMQPAEPTQHAASSNIGMDGRLCELSVHVAQGLMHIEVEPLITHRREMPTAIAQRMITHLQRARDETAFHQLIVDLVHELTGYDRVMLYRFRHDDSGDVIAESRVDDIPGYLGVRFPASDIPAQARQLYLANRIRIIPDAGYTPVPILPPLLASGESLDMSQHVLRSVSPVHLAYLANMGVGASMSISVVVEDRLWGLIACHHREPLAVDPINRMAADLFGVFVSMRLGMETLAEKQTQRDAFERARDAIETLLQKDANARALDPALLRKAVQADAVLICDGEAVHGDSDAISADMRDALIRWASEGDLRHASRRDDFPSSASDTYCGVLCARIGPHGWLVLLRQELIEDVQWAGSPDEAYQQDTHTLAVGPRNSFQIWHEQSRGQSLPWTEEDVDAARRLQALLGKYL